MRPIALPRLYAADRQQNMGEQRRPCQKVHNRQEHPPVRVRSVAAVDLPPDLQIEGAGNSRGHARRRQEHDVHQKMPRLAQGAAHFYQPNKPEKGQRVESPLGTDVPKVVTRIAGKEEEQERATSEGRQKRPQTQGAQNSGAQHWRGNSARRSVARLPQFTILGVTAPGLRGPRTVRARVPNVVVRRRGSHANDSAEITERCPRKGRKSSARRPPLPFRSPSSVPLRLPPIRRDRSGSGSRSVRPHLSLDRSRISSAQRFTDE